MGYSYFFGERGYSRHRSRPDYVIHAIIISVDGFTAVVKVYHGSKSRFLQTEEIQPVAVLTPFVAVILVLRRALNIADEKQHTALPFHFFRQCPAPADIYIFTEHSVIIYVTGC